MSLTDPAFYRRLLTTKFSYSAKYFVLYYGLLGIAAGLLVAIRDLPELNRLGQDYIYYLEEEFPDDLVLELKDNRLTATGVAQPITLPFIEPDHAPVDDLSGLLTLSTASDSATNSLITLYADRLTLNLTSENQSDFGYDQIGADLYLDKNRLSQIVPELKRAQAELLWYVPFVVALGVFGVYGAFVAAYLVLLTTVVYLINLIGARPLSFLKTYQLGLHAITFAQTASFLQYLLFRSYQLPSIFHWAFFGAMALGLYSINSRRGDE